MKLIKQMIKQKNTPILNTEKQINVNAIDMLQNDISQLKQYLHALENESIYTPSQYRLGSKEYCKTLELMLYEIMQTKSSIKILENAIQSIKREQSKIIQSNNFDNLNNF